MEGTGKKCEDGRIQGKLEVYFWHTHKSSRVVNQLMGIMQTDCSGERSLNAIR